MNSEGSCDTATKVMMLKIQFTGIHFFSFLFISFFIIKNGDTNEK